MTFETWWQETYLESGIYTEKYWLGEKDAAKKAWNASLEEAAKWAGMAGRINAKEIRSLKEE